LNQAQFFQQLQMQNITIFNMETEDTHDIVDYLTPVLLI